MLSILMRMETYGLVEEVILLNARTETLINSREILEPLTHIKALLWLEQEMEPSMLTMKTSGMKLCTHTLMGKYGDLLILEMEHML